jgi:hypothetical protein
MREIVSPDPTPEDISRGYEGTAIRVRGMVVFAAAFVLSAAAIHTVIWYLLVGFQDVTAAAHAERFPPPVLNLEPVGFPPPLLQPSPGHEKIDWEDEDRLRAEQVNSLRASGEFKDVPGRERGTLGGLPIAGQVLPPLRVSDKVVKDVGEFVRQSRTAPTTLPAGSGAAGNQPGPLPVLPSGTQPAAEPKAGEPKAGEPKAGEPKAGEPKAGEPKATQPSGPPSGSPAAPDEKKGPDEKKDQGEKKGEDVKKGDDGKKAGAEETGEKR